MVIEVPCVMTIAGSDSGGGAGIEADLKTFTAVGVFGTCAITAITAQNTQGVYEVFPLPSKVVRRQIEAVLEDFEVKAVKTGMLYSEDIMVVVSEAIKKYNLKAVVDPVFQAGTGDSLIKKGDRDALITLIVPRALVLTPNKSEAESLSKMKIKSLEDAEEAARRISSFGAKVVIIKGGHFEGEVICDLLYYEGEFKRFEKPRLDVKPHGGGCVFSSAITAYLALDNDVVEAVEKAEQLIQESLKYALKVGHGRTPVNPSAHLSNEAERYRVLSDVAEAVEMIEAEKAFLPWIAEVGTQVGMAVPYATNRDHVAAVEGRIVKFSRSARAVGCVKFGVSSHIASIILTAMKHNPKTRAAVNLHHDPRLVEAFQEASFKVSSFERSLESADVKSLEGGTLSWGTEEAIKRFGSVPDIIYDVGEVGKEPMIRIIGTSATAAVNKISKALNYL